MSHILLHQHAPVAVATDFKMLAAYTNNPDVKVLVIAEVQNATQVTNIHRLVNEHRNDMTLLFVSSANIPVPENFIQINTVQ